MTSKMTRRRHLILKGFYTKTRASVERFQACHMQSISHRYIIKYSFDYILIGWAMFCDRLCIN